MAALSANQKHALRAVLDGRVVRDQPSGASGVESWHVRGGERLNGRTMDSLYARGYIELVKDTTDDVPRFWRRVVVITRDGRMALGLPGVDLDEARMRLRLYLIQHDLRATGGYGLQPSDVIHSTTRMEDGHEVRVVLRASDVERLLDALDGHL